MSFENPGISSVSSIHLKREGWCCCEQETKKDLTMGKAKKTRKFAVTKKMMSPKDTRVQANAEKAKKKAEELKKKEEPRQVEQAVSALFFQYNTQ